MSWPNLVKIGRQKVAEILSGFEDKKEPDCGGLFLAHHFTITGSIAPKIS